MTSKRLMKDGMGLPVELGTAEVSAAELAADSVDTSELVADSVTYAKLGDGAIQANTTAQQSTDWAFEAGAGTCGIGDSSSTVVTYATAFGAKPWVFIQSYDSTAGDDQVVPVAKVTTTQFDIVGGSSDEFVWFAIGQKA